MVECVWVKGVVIIFKKYNFFKAKITSSKSNNTCFSLKKSHHTSPTKTHYIGV
jgi:hypothetical protein